MKLHDALGVSPDASADDVRKAYRRRAKRAHPDQGGDAEAFNTLTSAYLVLRDPARRAHYESTGEETSAGVDSVRSAALSIIGQTVQQALLAENASSVDFIKIIRTNLEGMNRQIAANQKAIAAQRKTVERNGRRWRVKGGHPDVIAQIVASALRELESQVQKADHTLRVHAAAIEILDGYEYEHEAPAPRGAANSWIMNELTSGGTFSNY